MDAEQIASVKEQVFGHSTTHTPPPTNVVPTEQTPESIPTEVTPIVETTPAAVIVETPTVVDPLQILKENLGYDDWDTAKAAIAKLNSTPELKFANDESKQLFELIKDGRKSEVKAILDLQDKLAAVETLTPEDAIKLHIEQSNKHFKRADIEDVFEEKYSKPSKPVQDISEDENEYGQRVLAWQASIDKIDRRIQRDAIEAKESLSKQKTELVLPEISKPPVDEGYEAYKAFVAEQQKVSETSTQTKEAYEKLSPKDIAIESKFNDEANKLAFDFKFEPDDKGFKKAISLINNQEEYIKTYYDKDGNPDRVKYARDIYNGQNIEKIVSAAMSFAANQTMLQFVANQKNISTDTQRNFNTVPATEIQTLKQQVFGKTA